MNKKFNAGSVDELFEIVKAVQNGEDPEDYLERRKAEQEAAAEAAAAEEAAIREAASQEEAEEKAAARKEAAEEKAAVKEQAAREKAEKKAARRKSAGGRLPSKKTDGEMPAAEETVSENSVVRTQRQYGGKAVSREAETVGNRILRSLHMEHEEETAEPADQVRETRAEAAENLTEAAAEPQEITAEGLNSLMKKTVKSQETGEEELDSLMKRTMESQEPGTENLKEASADELQSPQKTAVNLKKTAADGLDSLTEETGKLKETAAKEADSLTEKTGNAEDTEADELQSARQKTADVQRSAVDEFESLLKTAVRPAGTAPKIAGNPTRKTAEPEKKTTAEPPEKEAAAGPEKLTAAEPEGKTAAEPEKKTTAEPPEKEAAADSSWEIPESSGRKMYSFRTDEPDDEEEEDEWEEAEDSMSAENGQRKGPHAFSSLIEEGEEASHGKKPEGGKRWPVITAIVIAALMIGLGVASVLYHPQSVMLSETETEYIGTDTEAPVVTAQKSNGMITLSAADEGSGVDTIWYAVVEDSTFDSLPQYQQYISPIVYQKGNTYYFYAVDGAGNQSEPVVTAMDTPSYPPVEGETEVTVSVIGDCVLGTASGENVNYSETGSFDDYAYTYGMSYFFENVRDILENDDITFANLEGPLTTTTTYQEEDSIYKGDPSYTEILQDGSIEVVTLSNDHTSDYGAKGLADTEANLTEAGIAYCIGSTIAYQEVSGVKVACIGISGPDIGTEYEAITRDTIYEAQAAGAQLIVVAYHWGTEQSEAPDEAEQTLAHTAIDCGADLVVGHHPQSLQGIEKYNGKYIVYSLGNFCFGADANPEDPDTMIFRQTFMISESGLEEEDNIEIIPCTISSVSSYNDFRPTPASGEKADEIMARINEYSEAFGDITYTASTGL